MFFTAHPLPSLLYLTHPLPSAPHQMFKSLGCSSYVGIDPIAGTVAARAFCDLRRG
jgi:hypothetical protein